MPAVCSDLDLAAQNAYREPRLLCNVAKVSVLRDRAPGENALTFHNGASDVPQHHFIEFCLASPWPAVKVQPTWDFTWRPGRRIHFKTGEGSWQNSVSCGQKPNCCWPKHFHPAPKGFPPSLSCSHFIFKTSRSRSSPSLVPSLPEFFSCPRARENCCKGSCEMLGLP